MDTGKDDSGNGDDDGEEAEVSDEVDVGKSFLGVVEVGFFVMFVDDLDCFLDVDSLGCDDRDGSGLERGA